MRTAYTPSLHAPFHGRTQGSGAQLPSARTTTKHGAPGSSSWQLRGAGWRLVRTACRHVQPGRTGAVNLPLRPCIHSSVHDVHTRQLDCCMRLVQQIRSTSLSLRVIACLTMSVHGMHRFFFLMGHENCAGNRQRPRCTPNMLSVR